MWQGLILRGQSQQLSFFRILRRTDAVGALVVYAISLQASGVQTPRAFAKAEAFPDPPSW